MKRDDRRRKADVLRYWHAIELFDPQDIPRPRRRENLTRKPGTRCEQAISIGKRGTLPPLPWQPGHPRHGEQPGESWYGSTWRHTVYGGVFSFRAVRTALASVLGYAEIEDYAGTQDRDGALFAFVVDEAGLLIENTVAFSSCAWATGRLRRPDRGRHGWLDGFADATGECERALSRLLSKPVSYLPSPPGTALGGTRDWRRAITDILGAAAVEAVSGLISTIAPVVGDAVGAGAAGSVINRATESVEQEEQPHEAEPAQAAPATVGHGRVVQIPDLVGFAAHVADVLGLPAGLANPRELRVVSDTVRRKKDGSLPDPEPVFLSSPVADDLELIKDAPRLSPALDGYLGDPRPPRYRTDLRHDRVAVLNGVRPDAFPLARWPSAVSEPLAVSQQFAVNTILAELAEGGVFSVNGPPGTGKTTLLRDLIAAIVVRRATVLARLPRPEAAFAAGQHKWADPEGMVHVVSRLREDLTGFEIVVASSNNNAVENITKELPALTAIGAAWQAEADYFGEQAAKFLGEPAWGMVAAPLGNAEKRRDFQQRFWWRNAEFQALLQSMERDPPPVSDWQDAVDRFTQALEEAAAMAADRAAADTALRSGVDDAQVRDAQHKAKQAVRELADAGEKLKRVTSAITGLQQATRSVKAQVAAARQRAIDAARDADALISRRADGEQRIRLAREAWGPAFPEHWLELDQDAQERAAPWSDEEWTTARTQVFLAALDLHRAFIAGAGGRIRQNLRQLIAALAREPGAPPPAAERAAWQTLFLVVPVISTTFASCGRMFGALGAGSLGWVLVDEGGQAVPQHAVGALWRARRAVITGDPLQLEPIFGVPGEVQDRLRDLFGTDRRWLPAGTSAQGMADRRNRWGTSILTENRTGDMEEVWVGAPLRVHRRCEEPMFGISNTIAYQGLMVCATDDQPFPGGSRPDYPASSWVDVAGPSEGKWVPAQGRALMQILRRLHVENAVSLDRIYVLSPFRDVVTQCRRLALGEFEAEEWAASHVGTVHRMQGKEADVVVLVLGTDPSPAKKARDWAARPANLLNVAVSRARRRLFVIGNHAEWRDVPNFREAARLLHRHPWPHPRSPHLLAPARSSAPRFTGGPHRRRESSPASGGWSGRWPSRQLPIWSTGSGR